MHRWSSCFSGVSVLLMGILLIISTACVKNLNLEKGKEKKVVVIGAIHSLIRPHRPGGEFSPNTEYYLAPNRQHIYIYYSNAEGDEKRIPEADVKLYDDKTGALLAVFDRVSDYEWQADYCPESIDSETQKKYDLHYRLEITGIPGKKLISAVSSFEKTVNIDCEIQMRDIQVPFDTVLAFPYYQTRPIEGPAWVTMEANGCKPEYPNEPEIKFSVNKIISNLVYTDRFNYNETEKSYLYAIKLGEKLHEKEFIIVDEPTSALKYNSQGYWTRVVPILKFVSKEYDQYLKTSISYALRHGDNADPLQYLYEDQVYSNINGGIGFFGIEALNWLYKW
ncbi:MAG: DUF4249 family protein [Bacteroidales bacterium]|nr:DUF4249 family protein [Bacteroidales bacterium]